MIAGLIDWCIRNRVMVLILAAFLALAGLWSVQRIKVDAIPDLSDTQVIIYTEYKGQAPQIIQDQVTYPLTTAMLGTSGAKAVRGYSYFGTSLVYIIFEDGTDLNWARSRVFERMSYVKLPENARPQLGPDATGVGWVYEYVLTTGLYCPDHPNGAWHDPQTNRWYDSAEPGSLDAAGRARLVHDRVFPAGQAHCPLCGHELVRPQQDLASLRGLQDWYLRYELTGLEGVSEVATIGGFEKQYQVVVDPVKLLAFNMSLARVREAVEQSNRDVGGRVIEMGEREFAIQSHGYLGSLTQEQIESAHRRRQSPEDARTEQVLADLRRIALGPGRDGAAITLVDVAEIRLGPEMRRGIVDWNGQGEAVGAVVVMRSGENARATIERVRDRLRAAEASLPPGVAVETSYDRSDLIGRAIDTATTTLFQEMIVVALVCILFLLHARSELVAVCVVPLGVLTAVLIMHLVGINANIMSLGGIVIAIGVMVDSSVIMVENAHKHLDREEERVRAAREAGTPAEPIPRTRIIAEAAREVGPSLFFALMVLTVSFLPVFLLGEQQGRLFKPLAYTKTLAMAASCVLSITLIPVLMSLLITARVLPRRWGWHVNLPLTLAIMFIPAGLLMIVPMERFEPYRAWIVGGWAVLAGMLLVPQRIIHENANPLSWLQQRIYRPFFILAMRFKWLLLAATVLIVISAIYPIRRLGSEFMPPLEEGDLLYMPTTDPGISAAKARELLQQTDALIAQAPEVASVMGKVGRADSATDPAPLSMFETTIVLHRDQGRWRHVSVKRFYRDWPGWAKWLPAKIWSDRRPITTEELLYGFDDDSGHVPGLHQTVSLPGLTNSWTMPIRTRIDMLSTGIKTPVGVKLMGPDLATLADLSARVARAIQSDPQIGRYTLSAFPEKSVGGSYIHIVIHRDELPRYNLSVDDVQRVVATALGGEVATTTVEGLDRYTVNVRYPQAMRDSLATLRETLVATGTSEQVPLGRLADFSIRNGPDMIRSENARLSNWVYVDIAGIDVGTFVAAARAAVAREVPLPPGYTIVWAGQYEYMQSMRQAMRWAIPATLLLIVLLLYLAMRSWTRVLIVLLAVPFSLVGAVWLLYLLHYNLSLAVFVGLIALGGLDAETGMVMLLYLDNSFDRFKAAGRMRNVNDLWHAIYDGAVMRIRPKTMTVATDFIGLMPVLWATGAGADTMRRLTVPLIGGLFSSFVMELLIYPIIFYMIKRVAERHVFREAKQLAGGELLAAAAGSPGA